MISDEEGDESGEFELDDEDMLLEDSLLLTRKCDCCSNTIKDGDHERDVTVTPSKTRNRRPIHSMVSDSFSVPKGTLAEEDFFCCSSCTNVVADVAKAVGALKDKMAKTSNIHSFFQTFQMHMAKFPDSRSAHSPLETPDQPKLAPIVLDVSPKSTPKTNLMNPIRKKPNGDGEILLPTYIIAPIVSVGGGLPMKSRGSAQVNSTSDRPHSNVNNSSLTPSIKANISGNHRDIGGMTYADAILTSEEKQTYRKTQNTSSRVRVDCPAPYCGKFFTGQILTNAEALLNKHMKMFHQTFVCCHFCDKKVYGLEETMARQLLQQHLKDVHEKEPAIPNDEEAQVFPLGAKIFTYNCKFCPRKVHCSEAKNNNRLAFKRLIRQHRVKEHGVSRQCKYCKYVAQGTPETIQERMDKHVNLRHENRKEFFCRICQKPILHSGYIRRHEFSHFSQEDKEAAAEKDPSIQTKILCPTCGVVLKGYYTNSKLLLQSHMKKVHPTSEEMTQEKPVYKRLTCDQCDYTSSDTRLLARHKLWRHVQVDSPYFKYTCKKCGLGFLPGKGNEFKEHTMVCCDEAERPVLCTEPDCARRFKFKQNLMVHLIGFHKQTPEAARACLYPGLPIRDWIQNITTRVPKRKKMAAQSEVNLEDGGSPQGKTKISRIQLNNSIKK